MSYIQAMSSVIELFAITERQTSFPIRRLNWFKWKPSNLKHIYFFSLLGSFAQKAAYFINGSWKQIY